MICESRNSVLRSSPLENASPVLLLLEAHTLATVRRRRCLRGTQAGLCGLDCGRQCSFRPELRHRLDPIGFGDRGGARCVTYYLDEPFLDGRGHASMRLQNATMPDAASNAAAFMASAPRAPRIRPRNLAAAAQLGHCCMVCVYSSAASEVSPNVDGTRRDLYLATAFSRADSVKFCIKAVISMLRVNRRR